MNCLYSCVFLSYLVQVLASDRPIPHSKISTQYSYFPTYEKILQISTTKQISVLTCMTSFSLRKAARIALLFSCKWRAFWSWEFVLPAEPSLNNVNTVHILNGEIATFMYFPASTEVVCKVSVNPLKSELNPICYLLALLGGHHFLHVSRIRVKLLTLRWLMSYTYGAPILDVSRSHTTQHSR